MQHGCWNGGRCEQRNKCQTQHDLNEQSITQAAMLCCCWGTGMVHTQNNTPNASRIEKALLRRHELGCRQQGH